MDISKSDWILYRERIGDWQERYMERLCQKYVELLQSDKLPSDKFWDLNKQINKDKNGPGVIVTLKRFNLLLNARRVALRSLGQFPDPWVVCYK